MKLWYFLLLLIACQDSMDKHPNGTYTRFAEHEYGKEYDTLHIEPLKGKSFSITRKWRYHRIRNEGGIDTIYKTKHLTGEWGDGLLLVHQTGLYMQFEKTANKLISGKNHYTKLEQ